MVDVNPDGAKTRWENKEIQAHFNSSVFYQNYIYGTGDPGNLVCLDPQTGKVMWKQPGFEKGGLVAVDGTIIVADGKSGDIVMVSLSPDGYKELGRIKPLGGQTWTAPIIANGNLIVRNTTGLACVSLK
jgi:outer membrane protein assembly factor BamB